MEQQNSGLHQSPVCVVVVIEGIPRLTTLAYNMPLLGKCRDRHGEPLVKIKQGSDWTE